MVDVNSNTFTFSVNIAYGRVCRGTVRSPYLEDLEGPCQGPHLLLHAEDEEGALDLLKPLYDVLAALHQLWGLKSKGKQLVNDGKCRW